MKPEFLNLQHSESVVAQMSATIFAGLVHNPQFAALPESEAIRRSVELAIKLAVCTERMVKSDDEWNRKDGASGFLVG
jgi:hypothetical protein